MTCAHRYHANVDAYGLPASLSGWSSLDLGTTDGFFAFEMERRGSAPVVAIDVGVGTAGGSEERFERVRAERGSAVRYVDGGLPAIAAEGARFDLIVVGHCLASMDDPLSSLRLVHRLTGTMLLVELDVHPSLEAGGRPVLEIVPTAGRPDAGGWMISSAALRAMLVEAGFAVQAQLGPFDVGPGHPQIVTIVARAGEAPVQASDPIPASREPIRVDATRDPRVLAELENFNRREVIHDLPPAHHFWATRHLLPRLRAVIDAEDINDLYVNAIRSAIADLDGRPARVVSIGAGDCEIEVGVAESLRVGGEHRFTIECLDLNAALLERGRALAAERGVSERLSYTASSVADWRPRVDYDVCIANHALHHVVELEQLFTTIADHLTPQGRFVTSDMIGRNGHMCWPEVLEVVERLWAEAPERYKYNHQLSRLEKEFVNWDCSTEGFEGIRAQDILPLLVERFEFESFLAFGCLSEIFTGRSFGPNLDPEREEDREFVDEIERITEAGIDAARIKPTMMIAVMRSGSVERTRCHRGWTPQFCVRPVDVERLGPGLT